MPTTGNHVKYLPLAIVVVLHVAGTAWCLQPVGMSPYTKSLPAAIVFPIQMSLIAIWLAVQPNLWQRLPWAIMATSVLVAVYHAARFPLVIEVMTLYVLPGAVLLVAVLRQFIDLPPVEKRWRLSVRHLLLWTAAVALGIVLLRDPLTGLIETLRKAEWIDYSSVLFSVIVGLEYLIESGLLAILVLRRKFWPWIIAYLLILLPVLSVLESGLFSLLFDYPWYYEWEGLVYGLLQTAILSVTLLAWRHSGLLRISNSRRAAAETPVRRTS